MRDKEKEREEKEKKARGRVLTTELTTFRYRPRRTEAHREAAVPPSRAASAVAIW